jgi:hypothetical protein
VIERRQRNKIKTTEKRKRSSRKLLEDLKRRLEDRARGDV